MPTATINGLRLYYEVRGKGQPLMLVAGLASDSLSWRTVVGDLAAHYRVIVLDHRGCGRTTPTDAPISIERMADDCVALAKDLGISSVHLLGHSMGGFVAQVCAVRHPGFVNKLILEATTARNSPRNNALFDDWAAYLESGMAPTLWFRNLFYWIFSRRFFDDRIAVRKTLALAVGYAFPQTTVAFRNQVTAIAAFDGRKELSKITARTLVIAAREDLLFPQEAAVAFAKMIPGARFHLMENAAHSMHVEQPGQFVESVLKFLGSR